jgi:hypothetical protein
VAVDADKLAGDVAVRRGAEEHDGARDIVGFSDALRCGCVRRQRDYLRRERLGPPV